MKLVALAMLLVGRTALAQAPSEVPPTPADDKSLLTAYVISDAAVAVPMLIVGIGAEGLGEGSKGLAANALGTLGIAALVLGPSAGHWYVGEAITTGLVLRVMSAAAFAGFAISDPGLARVSTVFGLLGSVGLWGTGVIWDVATLPGAVHRFNREHAIALAPFVTANGPAPGLSIGGTF